MCLNTWYTYIMYTISQSASVTKKDTDRLVITRRVPCLPVWLHIYYAHLTGVEFQHSVRHESLLIYLHIIYYIYWCMVYISIYMFMYIFACIYMYVNVIYIYIYIYIYIIIRYVLSLKCSILSKNNRAIYTRMIKK